MGGNFSNTMNMEVGMQTGTDEEVEVLLKKIAMEKRGKKSDKPDLQSLKHLEALSSEYFETSGIVSAWLKQEVKWA